MELKNKLELIISILDDMKAVDIEAIDIREKTSLADYFVVCTGTSDTHIYSLSEKVKDKLKEQNILPFQRDTKSSDWVILDYSDIVVHIMKEEMRQFYDLETLWKNTRPIRNSEE